MAENNKEKILLVDDNPTNLQVLFGTLENEGYELMIAKSGESAIEIAEKANPQLILLDIMMPPGINGYETCKRLKANPRTADAAIIFLSALDETKNKIEGFDLGAVDYIAKPFKDDEVIARVKTHLTIRRLNEELKRELMIAQELLDEVYKRLQGPLLGISGAVKKLREAVEKHKQSDETILLVGPPGSGDESVARAIHHKSHRRHRPFIHVLCSTVRASQKEELFGHVLEVNPIDSLGKFDLAKGGTLYLDSVNRLDISLQKELITILKEIESCQSEEKSHPIDVRVICSATSNLSEDVVKGTFLDELKNLLEKRRLSLPTLAERKEDIPLLADHYIQETANKLGKIVEDLSPTSKQRLMDHYWPGNIRELRDIINHVVVNTTTPIIEIDSGFFEDVNAGINNIQINYQVVNEEVDQLLKDFIPHK